MKYVFLMISFAFLVSACTANATFVQMPLPHFKTQFKTNTQTIGVNVEIKPINLRQEYAYTDDFKDSILKIRLDREIALLKHNLEEQFKNVLSSKGYKVVKSNAEFELYSDLLVVVRESNAKRDTQLFGGEAIKSNLYLNFEAKLTLVKSGDKVVETRSKAGFASPAEIVYPVRGSDGLFKIPVSNVPTQINKGLEQIVFDIDKTLISFYKNTLTNLYNNATKYDTTTHQIKEEPSVPVSTEEGIIIFE